MSKKVPNDPKKSQKGYKISVRGLFRHFFDTPGRESFLRRFGDFGARACGDSCNRNASKADGGIPVKDVRVPKDCRQTLLSEGKLDLHI